MLDTEEMPSPDGAPFMCATVFYPYGEGTRCPKVATTVLTVDAFRQVENAKATYNYRHPVNHMPIFTGRMVCDTHLGTVNDLVVEYV